MKACLRVTSILIDKCYVRHSNQRTFAVWYLLLYFVAETILLLLKNLQIWPVCYELHSIPVIDWLGFQVNPMNCLRTQITPHGGHTVLFRAVLWQLFRQNWPIGRRVGIGRRVFAQHTSAAVWASLPKTRPISVEMNSRGNICYHIAWLATNWMAMHAPHHVIQC